MKEQALEKFLERIKDAVENELNSQVEMAEQNDKEKR